jgi:hypothetical protein
MWNVGGKKVRWEGRRTPTSGFRGDVYIQLSGGHHGRIHLPTRVSKSSVFPAPLHFLPFISSWTQGVTPVRQALYHKSHSSSPFCVDYFWDSLDCNPPLCASPIRWQAHTISSINWDEVLWTFCLGKPQTTVSVFQIARITGLSHQTQTLVDMGSTNCNPPNFCLLIIGVSYLVPPHSSLISCPYSQRLSVTIWLKYLTIQGEVSSRMRVLCTSLATLEGVRLEHQWVSTWFMIGEQALNSSNPKPTSGDLSLSWPKHPST